MKLITVFNTCGIGGKENAGWYIGHLHSILNQKNVDMRVVWSSCCNQPEDWNWLMDEFRGHLSYYLTGDVLPVNMTFNHACRCAAREFGMPDGFVYIDSGVHFGHDHFSLLKLVDTHQAGPFGMTAAMTDEDNGFNLWFPGRDPNSLFSHGRFVLPVGMTMNLHCQIFDRRIVEMFGHPMPDIFASQCTESVFTFMCAAAKLRMVVHGERVRHLTGLDGPSAGFPLNGRPGWRHLLPHAPRTMEEIIADAEGRASGFGYEECQQICVHDGGCYQEDGDVKDPERLARFIRQNLYLTPKQFDYEQVNHVFIP